MEELCDLSVRSLEELIDYQEYPVKAAEISTINRRSLGIGYIGLAHYLAKHGEHYEDLKMLGNSSTTLLKLSSIILLKSSNELAKEKGACGYFHRTKYSRRYSPNRYIQTRRR